MKTVFHKANTRGLANHGWLLSNHTFSFANYYNPERVNFGTLRVFNDDFVEGGMGFGTHPHDNMEIVSIPLSGDLEHKDSTGRNEVIKAGDVQIMSAGSGIRHSEYNHNKDKRVNFLQIWVFPKMRDIAPRYEQKTFKVEDRKNKFQRVVSPSEEGAVWINQDAYFSLGNFDKGATESYQLHHQNQGVYVFVIDGSIEINGQKLEKRDGLGISETDQFELKAIENAEVLLVEVPMELK